jgi:hypothetical protein
MIRVFQRKDRHKMILATHPECFRGSGLRHQRVRPFLPERIALFASAGLHVKDDEEWLSPLKSERGPAKQKRGRQSYGKI